jgi:uncharacterized protein (TIGR00255 family)
MTGYGEGREENERVEVYLQIKTLNHRFLEIEIYPSQPISFALEKTIKDSIKRKIKRGKVIIDIKIKRKKLPLSEVIINQNLISYYYKALSQTSKRLELTDKITLSHILSLPEIVCLKKEGIIKENVKSLLNKNLKKALGQLLQMREKEGKEHFCSIKEYSKNIQKNVLKIEKETPLIQRKYKNKTKEILGKLIDQPDRKKVLNELSSLVWRGDISEEILRLHSHLDQFQTTLKNQGPIGNRLKFILQELQREINTIGAKAITFTISNFVVQIKEDLEKIREVSQNIE